MRKFLVALIAFFSVAGLCADINELAGRLPDDASFYFVVNTSKQMQAEINLAVEKSVGIKEIIPTLIKKLAETNEMKEFFSAFDEAKVKPEEILSGKTFVAVKMIRYQNVAKFGRPGTILVAGATQISDAKAAQKILEKYQKSKVEIEGMNVLVLDGKVFVAILDDAIAFAASDAEEVSSAALKNFISKTGSTAFKSKPAYKELVAASDSSLMAYRIPDGVVQELTPGNFYSLHSLDEYFKVDSIFGLHAIKGARGAIQAKGGAITSNHEIVYDRCLLKEHITVLGAVKEFEAAGYVPENCAGAVGLRIKGGGAIFEVIEGFIKKFENREGRKFAEADEQFKAKTGIGMKEAFSMVQDEIVAFAVISDLEKFERRASGLCFVGRVNAGKETTDLLGKLAEWIKEENGGAWAVEEYNGKTITYYDGKDFELAYSLLDNYLVVGFGKAPVKAVIDTKGKSPIRTKAGNCTAFIYENTHVLAGLLADNAPADFPKIDKNEIRKDAYGITRISFEETALKTASEGPSIFNLTIPSMVVALIGDLSYLYWQSYPVPVQTETATSPGDIKPVAVPEGKEERAKFFAELIQKLGSDDPDEREASMHKLLGCGDTVVEYLVPAYEKTSDAEIRSRIIEILKTLKKYSAVPQLSDSVVASTVSALKTAVKDGYPMWNITEDYIYYATPSYIVDQVQYYVPEGNKEAFSDPEVVANLISALGEKDVPKVARGALCLFAAQYDTTKAEKKIFELIASADDEYTKGHLYTLLGNCRTAEAQKKIIAGLRSDSIAVRRASFFAARNCKSKVLADELAGLLESGATNETKLLASWTILEISGGKILVNPYLSEAERKSQIASAKSKLATLVELK